MEKITYNNAIERLNEIMQNVQGGKMDIDQLSGALKEAKELIQFCREKLYKVDEEVKSLLDDLSGDSVQ